MAKMVTFVITNTHIRIVIIVASNEAKIGLQRPASTMRTHTRDTGKPFQKKISQVGMDLERQLRE